MVEWIVWWVSNPVLYGFTCWFVGIITGIIIGRSMSTRKIEVERDEARYDLNAIKDVYEMLKKK